MTLEAFFGSALKYALIFGAAACLPPILESQTQALGHVFDHRRIGGAHTLSIDVTMHENQISSRAVEEDTDHGSGDARVEVRRQLNR